MKMKTLMVAVLLIGGAATVTAQEDCNANSSISTEAVKAGNYQDAYLPWKAVLETCPTLRYYTFLDGAKILKGFLGDIKDRKSADYKKYFDELMHMYDLRMKYTPEFLSKGTKVPSVGTVMGVKAVDYLAYAPSVNLDSAYTWLKQSVDAEKENSESAVLHYFVDMSLNKLKANPALKEEFFQDYLTAADYAEKAYYAEANPNKKTRLGTVKDNIEAMFINSGTASCEDLQELFGPKVEAAQNDSVYLKKAIGIMKVMKCTESEAYFQASYYMYKIHPTSDAAVGCGYMSFKKGDYDTALQYFDEALNLENNPERKAQIATAAAVALFSQKRLAQARSYLYKAIGFNPNYGLAYIQLAHIYASNPNWSDEPALNRCVYYVVLDKLQQAKRVDPSPKVVEEANKNIATYSQYTPKTEDLFMLGIKKGDRVEVKGWIGESTTVR
ncbi:MAG: hypothetical protein LBL97_06710 [Prevotellaceae bacterium]|jgi:tetratricopeptide (TPR) repeat protein|nr:hypothetical protein [Prevotellaceae bacterium]